MAEKQNQIITIKTQIDIGDILESAMQHILETVKQELLPKSSILKDSKQEGVSIVAKKLYLFKPAENSQYSTPEYLDIRKVSDSGCRFQLTNDYWCGAYYYNVELFEVGVFYWVSGVHYCKCIEKTSVSLVMEVINT